mmetsp:Transcript_99157/g.280805  ORF Transcript_99157/g.280805 Transcript_99157/m.280805 type:complete len:280 (-) Transcript_99157:618-1457(-)
MQVLRGNIIPSLLEKHTQPLCQSCLRHTLPICVVQLHKSRAACNQSDGCAANVVKQAKLPANNVAIYIRKLTQARDHKCEHKLLRQAHEHENASNRADEGGQLEGGDVSKLSEADGNAVVCPRSPCRLALLGHLVVQVVPHPRASVPGRRHGDVADRPAPVCDVDALPRHEAGLLLLQAPQVDGQRQSREARERPCPLLRARQVVLPGPNVQAVEQVPVPRELQQLGQGEIHCLLVGPVDAPRPVLGVQDHRQDALPDGARHHSCRDGPGGQNFHLVGK